MWREVQGFAAPEPPAFFHSLTCMKKQTSYLAILGLAIAAVVLLTMRSNRHAGEQSASVVAAASVKAAEVTDSEKVRATDLPMPDLSGVWQLEPGSVRDDNTETVLTASGDSTPGQPKPATFRLAADSGLGQAIKSVRYAFDAQGDTLSRMRLTGNARHTETVFKVIATEGNSVRMEDSESTAPAMLTLGQDGKLRQQSGDGVTQVFVREG